MKAFLLIPLSIMPYATSAQPLRTVPLVHLDRYAGKWYEIASYPQRFQKGCHCTTATYTRSDKGYLVVENQCNRDTAGGKLSSVKGKAFAVEGSGNAKLKVQFFWPFAGKYWIIDLAQDYSYAVVGHPNRKYLWILSRDPLLPSDVYTGILTRLVANGYDTGKLQLTDQRWLPTMKY
ncbi:MAG: lipocalin family protein [Flavobacteriales bacterium]